MERGFGGEGKRKSVQPVENSCQSSELHFSLLSPIPYSCTIASFWLHSISTDHAPPSSSPLFSVPYSRKKLQPQSQLRPRSLLSHSSPISTPGMLVNDFPLVNLLLVPWQGKLFSRNPFAITFPFNFADALASFAFVVFGEFNKVEDVFLFVGGCISYNEGVSEGIGGRQT